MKNEMQHTPGPWTFRGATGIICTEKGNLTFIAEVRKHGDGGFCLSPEDSANAAYIVHCCNLHHELVTALEQARRIIIEHHSYNVMKPQHQLCPYCTSKKGDAELNQIAAVLAKAKGE